MWVANLYYWGFNQYIIQRTLAAKSLEESQKGIAFAAFLKLIIPLIVVVPGIVAYVLNAPDGVLSAGTIDPGFLNDDGSIANDNAAPWLIKFFCSQWVEGIGPGSIGGSSGFITRLHAQFHVHDLYDGYLPALF